MESPSPTRHPCFNVCNNNIIAHYTSSSISIDTVDNVSKTNATNITKHPGQAIKIITEKTGENKIVKEEQMYGSQVCKSKIKATDLKTSKSYTNVYAADKEKVTHSSKSTDNIKARKSCDENLIKLIFTKHGIQVVSDVEMIV